MMSLPQNPLSHKQTFVVHHIAYFLKGPLPVGKLPNQLLNTHFGTALPETPLVQSLLNGVLSNKFIFDKLNACHDKEIGI